MFGNNNCEAEESDNEVRSIVTKANTTKGLRLILTISYKPSGTVFVLQVLYTNFCYNAVLHSPFKFAMTG